VIKSQDHYYRMVIVVVVPQNFPFSAEGASLRSSRRWRSASTTCEGAASGSYRYSESDTGRQQRRTPTVSTASTSGSVLRWPTRPRQAVAAHRKVWRRSAPTIAGGEANTVRDAAAAVDFFLFSPERTRTGIYSIANGIVGNSTAP
jgi:hypothetical protein